MKLVMLTSLLLNTIGDKRHLLLGFRRICEMDKVYGIYNTKAKCFQFGIREPSKNKAWKRLFDKIGNDARKWRFEVREIKEIGK